MMLTAQSLTKRFAVDGQDVLALDQVNLEVKPGEFLAVVGKSGSGKTTVLNVLSTLLKPDGGSILYKGEDIGRASKSRLNELRARDFSVVFQFHHLTPYLTALENVLLPFVRGFKPVSRADAAYARECLARVGLAGKEDRPANRLSGGEQQRTAIARALVKRAKILFADEPTGSLDSKTGMDVMHLLREVNQAGPAVVMVTHNDDYAALAHRVVRMADGKIVDSGR